MVLKYTRVQTGSRPDECHTRPSAPENMANQVKKYRKWAEKEEELSHNPIGNASYVVESEIRKFKTDHVDFSLARKHPKKHRRGMILLLRAMCVAPEKANLTGRIFAKHARYTSNG